MIKTLIPVFGELIQQYIKDGLIVPIAITCKLIENAMNKRHQWVLYLRFSVRTPHFYYSIQGFKIVKTDFEVAPKEFLSGNFPHLATLMV